MTTSPKSNKADPKRTHSIWDGTLCTWFSESQMDNLSLGWHRDTLLPLDFSDSSSETNKLPGLICSGRYMSVSKWQVGRCFSPHNHQRPVWRAQWCFSHSPAENDFPHLNSPQKDSFLCYLKASRRRCCEPTWLVANSPMCARQNHPGTRRSSPGRHVCGKGDAVGDEGQRRGAGDVLPLRRRHPSCMETPGIRWAHFLFKWFV